MGKATGAFMDYSGGAILAVLSPWPTRLEPILRPHGGAPSARSNGFGAGA